VETQGKPFLKFFLRMSARKIFFLHHEQFFAATMVQISALRVFRATLPGDGKK
jgi:hypothetical protein